MKITMTRIKRILFTLAASLGLLAPLSVPVMTHAAVDINDGICQGAQLDPTATGCNDAAISSSTQDVQSIIKTGIDLFSLVVGIIAVIMIIIGGVKYITSGGDAGNVTGAKNTILYAIIGLIVVALAQTIVYFVLNEATS
jgi:hypothetical protein